MLESIGVINTAAHPVKILRNDGVIGLRQCKPVQRLIAIVTGSCSYPEADEMIYGVISVLCHLGQLTDDDVRPGYKRRSFPTGCSSQRRHHQRFHFAIHQCLDFDWLHRRADGDFSNRQVRVRWTPEGLGKLFGDE